MFVLDLWFYLDHTCDVPAKLFVSINAKLKQFLFLHC